MPGHQRLGHRHLRASLQLLAAMRQDEGQRALQLLLRVLCMLRSQVAPQLRHEHRRLARQQVGGQLAGMIRAGQSVGQRCQRRPRLSVRPRQQQQQARGMQLLARGSRHGKQLVRGGGCILGAPRRKHRACQPLLSLQPVQEWRRRIKQIRL